MLRSPGSFGFLQTGEREGYHLCYKRCVPVMGLIHCYRGEVPSSFVMSGGTEDTGVLGDLHERCAS